MRLFRWGLVAATFAVLAAWCVGWFGAWHPAFDSFGHFRIHLALLAIVGLAVLLRGRRLLGFASVLAVAVPTWLGLPGPSIGKHAGPLITVAQQNLRYANRDFGRIERVLRGARADVLLLQEVGRTTRQAVDRLSDAFPHAVHCPHPRGWTGVSILSRLPLTGTGCGAVYGLAYAQLEVEGNSRTLVSVHAVWPWPHNQWKLFDILRPELQGLPRPVIAAGDFNAAPWSAFVAAFGDATGTAVKSGSGPTWSPIGHTTGFVGGGLSLDHVLSGCPGDVVRVKPLPRIGSDHRGRVATIRVDTC